MELKPNIGLGKLKFGMFQKMVYETLGIPDKIRPEEGNPSNLYLEYYKLQLRITIYKNEGNRLGYLHTSNPKLIYNNKKIIGLDTNKVKKEVFGTLVKNWEIDDYDFFSTHADDENWITLNEEYGRVISVEFGAPWKNEYEYDWPNQFEVH